MAQGHQKFIARNRAARVQIEYDVELYGASKKTQLPFVVGVLADLSGRSEEALPAVADRKLLDIDIDNFEARMAAICPRVAFVVPDTVRSGGDLTVDIAFESMDDFAPAAVVRKVVVLAELLAARQQLVTLMSYMDGKSGAEELISTVLRDRDAGVVRAQPRLERGEELEAGLAPEHRDGFDGMPNGGADFSRLIEKEFRPRTHDAKLALEDAVQGHAGKVRSLCFVGSGAFAFSSSYDRYLKAWAIPALESNTAFAADSAIAAAAVSETGGMVVAGDAQGCAHFLRVDGI